VLRFADLLLAEYDREAALTRRLITRVPVDRLDWRPHDRSMTLGRLATHLAELAGWGASVLTADAFDLANRPPVDRREASVQAVIDLFDANVRLARAALVGRTDGELLAPWTLRRDGQDVFTVPRLVAARTVLLQHAAHHRGQLSVYLRLLDVPLPPLYGPTADEGAY
jgi:uncharacterized damage-inducible protein DinB